MGVDILTISPRLIIELECIDAVEEEEGGLPSFLPPTPTLADLTPRSQRLLGLKKGGGRGGRGGDMTEEEFREGLARDACGTAVFANSMKLFVADLRSLEKVFFDYLDEKLQK